jgi:hypothetical protein
MSSCCTHTIYSKSLFQWLVQQCAEPLFHLSILISDKEGFGRYVISFQNHHQWAEDNSHGVLQCRHQQQLVLMFGQILLVIDRPTGFAISAYRK